MVVAPTFHNHMMRATLPTYEVLLEPAFRAAQRKEPSFVELTADGRLYHRTDGVIRFKNNSCIWFGTAEEPQNLYGPSLGGWHLDEAGQMHEQALTIMMGRLRGAGALQGIATFTPRGDKSHWTHRKYGKQYEKALGLANDGHVGAAWHATHPVFTLTARQNPFLAEHILREMEEEAKHSPLARQEAYGEWLDLGGLVYEKFDPNIHVRPLPENTVFRRVAAGIDWGIRAPTVIVVIGEDYNGRLWWAREFYQRNCLDTQIAEECARIMQIWPNIQFYCDPEGKAAIQALRARYVPARAGNNDVDTRVRRIWKLLDKEGSSLPGMFVTPSCPYTITEFESWCWKVGTARSGLVRYDEVERGSHCLDAGGYAILALTYQYAEPIRVTWGKRNRAPVEVL